MDTKYDKDSTTYSGDGNEVGREDRRTAMARRVASLKDSTLQAVEKRERLPQPLFWSLFNSRLKDIKKDKERARKLSDIFK